jgi:hypothetical protein
MSLNRFHPIGVIVILRIDNESEFLLLPLDRCQIHSCRYLAPVSEPVPNTILPGAGEEISRGTYFVVRDPGQ